MRRVSADEVIGSKIQLVSFYSTSTREFGHIIGQYTGDDDEGVLFVLPPQFHSQVMLGRHYYWVEIGDLLDEKRGQYLKKYAVSVKPLFEMPQVFDVEFVHDPSSHTGWCHAVTNFDRVAGINVQVIADHRANIGPNQLLPGHWQVAMRSVIRPVMDGHLVISVEPLRRIASSPRAARRQAAKHGPAFGVDPTQYRRPQLPRGLYP